MLRKIGALFAKFATSCYAASANRAWLTSVSVRANVEANVSASFGVQTSVQAKAKMEVCMTAIKKLIASIVVGSVLLGRSEDILPYTKREQKLKRRFGWRASTLKCGFNSHTPHQFSPPD